MKKALLLVFIFFISCSSVDDPLPADDDQIDDLVDDDQGGTMRTMHYFFDDIIYNGEKIQECKVWLTDSDGGIRSEVFTGPVGKYIELEFLMPQNEILDIHVYYKVIGPFGELMVLNSTTNIATDTFYFKTNAYEPEYIGTAELSFIDAPDDQSFSITGLFNNRSIYPLDNIDELTIDVVENQSLFFHYKDSDGVFRYEYLDRVDPESMWVIDLGNLRADASPYQYVDYNVNNDAFYQIYPFREFEGPFDGDILLPRYRTDTAIFTYIPDSFISSYKFRTRFGRHESNRSFTINMVSDEPLERLDYEVGDLKIINSDIDNINIEPTGNYTYLTFISGKDEHQWNCTTSHPSEFRFPEVPSELDHLVNKNNYGSWSLAGLVWIENADYKHYHSTRYENDVFNQANISVGITAY